MTQNIDSGVYPKLVSIVAPAYNEEDGLPEFVARLKSVMDKQDYHYEIVMVNDGSRDNTLQVMHELKNEAKQIAIVNLSRNFGKEIALTAGLEHANGDAVIAMDTDLQDPPELIPELLENWENGYDVVYAQRKSRAGESWLKKKTAEMFYSVSSRFGKSPIPPNVGDFRLMSRRVVNALLELPEHHRFMKGLFAWVGFSQIAVLYDRDPRYAGETKWNYWSLWNFALEGITSFTITPLIFSTYLGFSVAFLAFMYGVFIVFKALVFGEIVRGYPTIMVTILFLGGVQLIVLGVMGEYIGRTFNESKRRPLYFVESVDPAQPKRLPRT
jgi:polyisoprenyl-phosphate glycosyltransferase